MKKQINDSIKAFVVVLIVGGMFAGTSAYAANDPSIKGTQRHDIIASMEAYIQANIIENRYHVYDAVKGDLLRLKFKKLHDGIVKKGDYFVSCADFVDQTGRAVDMDFLVMADGVDYKTIQAVVHSIDGKKREYHLE